MEALRSWIYYLYNAIADCAGRFLMIEIIPGLHVFTLVIIGVFAMLVTFLLTGGEAT